MEFVYVVKREDLFKNSIPHGFVEITIEMGSKDSLTNIYKPLHEGFFIERKYAETDTSLKQIIPYHVIMHKNEVFVLERLNTQGESRLHNMLSIGAGGHINPIDTSDFPDINSGISIIQAGSDRELHEELFMPKTYDKKFFGVINDDTNSVGAVHYGVVFIVKIPNKKIAIKETDKMKGRFMSLIMLEYLLETEPERIESWSQFLIPHLHKFCKKG